MKSILKTVKQLETTYEVLEYIENVISKIKDSEFTNSTFAHKTKLFFSIKP